VASSRPFPLSFSRRHASGDPAGRRTLARVAEDGARAPLRRVRRSGKPRRKDLAGTRLRAGRRQPLTALAWSEGDRCRHRRDGRTRSCLRGREASELFPLRDLGGRTAHRGSASTRRSPRLRQWRCATSSGCNGGCGRRPCSSR
jgi:hypothetical protein